MINKIINLGLIISLMACKIQAPETLEETPTSKSFESEPFEQEPVQNTIFSHLKNNEICTPNSMISNYGLNLQTLEFYQMQAININQSTPYIKNSYLKAYFFYEYNARNIQEHRNELYITVKEFFELQGLILNKDFELDPNFSDRIVITILDKTLTLAPQCKVTYNPYE